MLSVSAKYLGAVGSLSRTWDLYIDVLFRNGTEIRLTKEMIDIGSFVFKEGATCSDTIQIGSTYSNTVEFRVINAEKQFTDCDFYRAKVYPFIGLDLSGDEDYEYIALGEFHILDNVKKFSTISITCFDNMCLVNKPLDFSRLVFPTEPVNLFDEIVTQCSIRYHESLRAAIVALPYRISSLLTNDPTCRDILAGLGIMLSKNIRFDRSGILEAFWYADVSRETTRDTRVGNSSYGDNQVIPTGVYLEDAYGNMFGVGTEEYLVALPTSPIIQGSEMSQPILEAALALLQTLPYRASTITWIGDPAIQAGDVLTHRDTAVGDLVIPVMRRVYKFAGTETIESLGMDNITKEQQSATERQLRKAFNKAVHDRTELETKIDQRADEVLILAGERFASKESQAALSISVDGIKSEVTRQSEDIASIKTSVVSVQQSAEDVSIKIQKIVDDGVNKVTTTTGYVLDEKGLQISKTGEEMQNRLDNTGMYVTRSGETILQADHTGVNAADVKVRNYLIIGNHARFEDYTDGTDSERTACFWI